MKKTLVTVENLNEHLCSDKLYCNNNIIITPGAKDLCSQRNIEIVYGYASSAQNCTRQSNSMQSGSMQSNSMQNMLINASNPTAPTCCGGVNNDPFEQILIKLAVALKEGYGITDLVQLRNLSLEAAKIIKKNL